MESRARSRSRLSASVVLVGAVWIIGLLVYSETTRNMPTLSFWASVGLFIVICAALVARPDFSALRVVVLSWASAAAIIALFIVPMTTHGQWALVMGLLFGAVATAALLIPVGLIASTSGAVRSSGSVRQH